MSPTHRRYLLLEQGVGSAVFNFFLNGAIAWVMFRSLDEVPLWGQQSIAGDTLGTSLILPLMTCLIVTPVARRQIRAGRFPSLGWTRASHAVLAWLPSGTLARALVLGLAGLVLLAPPTLFALGMLDVTHLERWDFITFKASFAAAEALLVTPVVALWAIAESRS